MVDSMGEDMLFGRPGKKCCVLLDLAFGEIARRILHHMSKCPSRHLGWRDAMVKVVLHLQFLRIPKMIQMHGNP